MHLILRTRVRSDRAIGHRADEQDGRIARQCVAQRSGGGALGGIVIDVGVIGGVGVGHPMQLANSFRKREGIVRKALPSRAARPRSEEHTSELQSLMRISYAVFCLKKKKTII